MVTKVVKVRPFVLVALTKVGFKNNLSMLLDRTSVLYSKVSKGLFMNYATHGRRC